MNPHKYVLGRLLGFLTVTQHGQRDPVHIGLMRRDQMAEGLQIPPQTTRDQLLIVRLSDALALPAQIRLAFAVSCQPFMIRRRSSDGKGSVGCLPKGRALTHLIRAP